MKRPFMQEDLRGHKLLAILDLLWENEEPLTVGQIQYRLARDRSIEISRDEIEAHLQWGLHQPGATNAPVRPIPRPQNMWMVVAKVPSIAEEIKAAGPPPFEQPEHPPIRYLIWFADGSNITRTGTISELAERYGTAIKIEEL